MLDEDAVSIIKKDLDELLQKAEEVRRQVNSLVHLCEDIENMVKFPATYKIERRES